MQISKFSHSCLQPFFLWSRSSRRNVYSILVFSSYFPDRETEVRSLGQKCDMKAPDRLAKSLSANRQHHFLSHTLTRASTQSFVHIVVKADSLPLPSGSSLFLSCRTLSSGRRGGGGGGGGDRRANKMPDKSHVKIHLMSHMIFHVKLFSHVIFYIWKSQVLIPGEFITYSMWRCSTCDKHIVVMMIKFIRVAFFKTSVTQLFTHNKY